MKNLYLTSLFCICALINRAEAAEAPLAQPSAVEEKTAAAESAPAVDPCGGFNYTPRLNLTTSYGKLRYSRDFDRAGLTELSRRYGLTEEGMYASGLSLIGVDWSVSLNTVARAAPDDTVCIFPTGVNVFIGFREPTVFLDKAMAENSCLYQQVLRHERQHLQVSVAALEYFLPRIRRQITGFLQNVRPRNVAGLSATDAATAAMNGEYVALIRPLVDSFKATLLYEQKKLDNTENYRRESAICRGRP